MMTVLQIIHPPEPQWAVNCETHFRDCVVAPLKCSPRVAHIIFYLLPLSKKFTAENNRTKSLLGSYIKWICWDHQHDNGDSAGKSSWAYFTWGACQLASLLLCRWCVFEVVLILPGVTEADELDGSRVYHQVRQSLGYHHLLFLIQFREDKPKARQGWDNKKWWKIKVMQPSVFQFVLTRHCAHF